MLLRVLGLAQIASTQLQPGPGRAARSPLAWSARQQTLLGPERVAVAHGETVCFRGSLCHKASGARPIRYPRAGILLGDGLASGLLWMEWSYLCLSGDGLLGKP